MTDRELPNKFYKYIRWESDKHRRILEDNRIFFCSPEKLNDPFDTSFNVRYDDQSPEMILEILRNELKQQSSEVAQSDIEANALSILKNNPDIFQKVVDDTLKENLSFIYNNLGVFSVCEVNDNILMWSHYGDSHAGACIGLNTHDLHNYLYRYFDNVELKMGLTPISYQDEYPVVDLSSPDSDIGEVILKTKASIWSYEKEWRFITLKRTNFEVELPDGIISEIILGCRMPSHHEKQIREIVAKKKSTIRMKKAFVNSKSFRLDIR